MEAAAEIDTDALSGQLAGDLLEGMGGEPKDAPEPESAIDAVEPEAPAEPSRERDDGGRFKAKAAEPAPVEPSPDLPAPKSWSKDMHPIWEKLAKGVPLNADESRKAATYYNTREEQMAKGAEGYRSDAEFGRAIRGVAGKHADLLKTQGLNEAQAFEYLLNAHRQLSSGTAEAKLAYLNKVADQYGIKIVPAAPADPNAPQPAPLSPEVKAALERLDRLEGAYTSEQQQRFENQKTAIANDVASFADAKDDKGNPKHPYFDECADHICLLLKGDPSMKLEAAYDTAVWANPVTRQKELARIQAERDAEFRSKAAEAAKSAKKSTSTNVKGRDTTRTPQAPQATVAKLDEAMSEVHAEIKSRS